MPTHRWTAAIRTAALLVLSACISTNAAAQVTTIEGRTADGALYAFLVPGNWNGTLIVYVHGIVDPGNPVAVPTTQDNFNVVRDAWLAQGYAIAASSFSENGFAVKSAVQRTHQLRGLFVSRVGLPQRTYLVGHSLGALAVAALAEWFPGVYDGAMPVCAPLAGGVPAIQYLGDARVAFDYFFPGVVPGGAFSVPEGTAFTPGSPVFMAVLGALTQGLFAPGQPTLQFASVARLPFTSPGEIVMSGMSAVGFSVRFTNDVLSRTAGQIPFDNINTVYTGSADDGALNAGIARFAATPHAETYFEHYYTPTGALQLPVLTLHTLWDPVVPFFNEAAFAVTVANAGTSDRLVQRSIARYGHCAVIPAETLDGFAALVNWAENGVTPAGGDATIR
jgi:pimeloyl-ACP methyl ester carboxylesterase